MNAPVPASERLIVALDVDSWAEASELVRSLGSTVSFYKIGLQLFLREGMTAVKQLIRQGKTIFLDLKIDDTPRTVSAAVRAIAIDGIELFTLQGNAATAKAAIEGRGERRTPRFLQVTFLSSWDTDDLKAQLGVASSAGVTIDDAVLRRTQMILEAGCEGLIASGSSVRKTREQFGDDVIIVTPGIRPSDSAKDDHKRSLTPYEAIRSGADYLVVGRPIRNARDRGEIALAIIRDIERALTGA